MLSAKKSSTVALGLSDQLLAIPSWTSDLSQIRLTPKEIEREIKKLEDFLVDRTENLSYSSDEYSQLTGFIGCYAALEVPTKTKLINTVVSGMGKISKLLSTSSKCTIEQESLEAMSILAYAIVSLAEKDAPTGTTSKKGKNMAVDWNHNKIVLMESIKSICASPTLPRLYQTYADLENLVGVFVKTAHTLAENSENCKVLQLRNLIVETLALCGTTLPYKNGLKTIILQDLNYLDHLAEVDADVLAKMSAIQEDTTLIDNILQHVGGIPFSVDDGPAAKIVSAFLLKLTVSDTKTVLRNVSALADFLDSDLYTMRMSMLEVFAILYCHLMLQEDRGDQARTQARSFLSAIEERLRDVNSFVRSKVLHVLFELVQASALPVPDRARLIELVVGRVMDKSSNVRRRAIQLLGEFLRKHPFCVDGGELSLKLFQDRLHDIDSHLDAIEPAEIKDSMMGSNEQLAIPSAEEELAKAQTMQTLLMQKRYYTDALTFVRQLDSVIPTLCKLLSSNIKTEVFEVMDFFVDSFVYKLHSSELGIKKMMHLIWEQDLSSEDGTKKSIKEHVLNCYRKVFLDVDARLEGKERVMSIASTLISLVSSSSIGDLASLEQIIAGFVKKGWIVESVIQALFSRRDNPEEQRSALILITMIGKHLPEIMSSRVDVVMKIGFGPLGQADSMVAEYTCIALRLLNGGDMKGSSDSTIRLPNDHVIFFKLVNMIKTVSASSRWLQFIAQAILTIYALADQPNVICGSLIQELSHDITEAANGHVRLGTLIKLIFIVGHVAVCELDHLEAIEKHLKRSKSKRPSIDSSMEGITATEEDDIVDAMRFIRENELLYGKDSILAVFGPFVASICSNNNIYPDSQLQNIASMTLAKFMTVSGQFCEEHLPLFLTILEKSPDALVRGNLTIAFADLAQSFSRIIDTNIVYLFRRLRDPVVSVKRNALMVLSHLSLTGIIKVKGQLGEIAKCILDPDQRVANLARLFFHELAGKDNTIYNHIPDIISTLSVGEEPLSEEDFSEIAKFIFDYIKKEKQMEGLVEKLCQRLRQCSTVRQARDLACCLTMINFTGGERTIRKLIEALPLYRDKLVDHTVYRYFVETLQKARKGAKTEIRTLLDEYEQKLMQAAGEGGADMEAIEAISQLSLHPQKPSKKPTRRRTGRRTVIEAVSDEEEDIDMEDMISDPEEDEKETTKDTKRSARQNETVRSRPMKEAIRPPPTQPKRSTRQRKIVMADSNDEEEDIF